MTESQIFVSVATFATLFELVPIAVFFLKKQERDFSQKLLLLAIILSFASDFFGMLNALWLEIPLISNAVSNLYWSFSILLLIWIYQIQLSNRNRTPFILLAIVMLSIHISSIVFDTGMNGFNTKVRAIFSIVMMTLSLLFLFKLIREPSEKIIYRLPMFWITCGFLIYYAGALFFFLARDYYISTLKSNVVLLWAGHNAISLAQYAFFAIGFWYSKNKAGALPSDI